MDKFIVKGPCKIKGEISISGSKNAALPILGAKFGFRGPNFGFGLQILVSDGFLQKKNVED